MTLPPKCQTCEDRIREAVLAERVSRRLCLTCTQNPMPPGVAYSLNRERDAIYEAECQGEVEDGFFRYSMPLTEIVAKNPAHWDIARKWDCRTGPNFFLWGDKGTGKSSMARYMLSKAIVAGRGVYDLLAVDIETQRMWTWPGNELAKRAKYAGVLLLDDLDNVPKWTGDGLNVLRSLFDFRERTDKKTIVTSNTDPDTLFGFLVDAMGGRTTATGSLMDRLWPCETLHFTGTSYRKRQLKAATAAKGE